MEDMGEKYERVCVGAVLVRNQDRHRDDPPLALLGKREAKRAFYPGMWDVLGGTWSRGKPRSRR